MKHLLTSVILIICFTSWTQTGVKLIRKAEVNIEKGQYKKALRLLNRADRANYGFCGLAWISADESIALNRAKAYDRLGQSQRAGDEINSLFHALPYNNFDSLKTTYYINQFGKEFVKKELDSCINTLSIGILDTIALMEEIGLDVRFSEEPFLISRATLTNLRQEISASFNESTEEELLEICKEAIRRQPFYQLLE